jgi:hypothetical protein
MTAKGSYVLVSALAALFVLPSAAYASHGKVGLWETTTTPDTGNAPAIPPEALAQMKAHGIKPSASSGRSFTAQFCMTAEEVNSETPPAMKNNPCKMTSSKTVGQTFSADMVCSGALQGTSHFTVTYDTPEHYKGRSEFNGRNSGHPFHSATAFEGRWLKADCGNVKPFKLPK